MFDRFSAFCAKELINICWQRQVYDSNQKQPPEVFYKKGVLKNFAKFTGKHLCQSLFFNKVAGLRNFAKFTGKHLCQRLFARNETLAQVLSCEFCEVFKNNSFTKHLRTDASVKLISIHQLFDHFYSCTHVTYKSMFVWQNGATSHFSVSLKSGACYITDQWGNFKIKTSSFHLLFLAFLLLWLLLLLLLLFFIIKFVPLSFSFLLWMTYQSSATEY